MNLSKEQIIDLKELSGEGSLLLEDKECLYYSQDVFSKGRKVSAVMRPHQSTKLNELVSYCYQQGIALFPRGGGLSYTEGYLSQTKLPSISLDMGALDQILEINEHDRFVRVQPGITWGKLHQVLSEKKLTTPFWGTLSGLEATVGAGISQNSVFFGSAKHGISAESVLGLKALVANGEELLSGCYLTQQQQAVRYFGPDLCGLLTGDCGALGIKTEICLRLINKPRFSEGYSFAFDKAENLFEAVAKVQSLNLCSECFGFDPVLQQQRMKRISLSEDISQLGAVLKHSENVADMLKKGAKIALAGRKFLDDVSYSLHCVIEADSKQEIANKGERLTQEIKPFGQSIENTIPVVIRSNPFVPPTSMVGPEGERWVPMHGIVRFSEALRAYQKVQDFFAAHRVEMEQHQIIVGYLMTVAGTNGFLLEPVFYWPDELEEFHRRRLPEAHLKLLKLHKPNLAAREKVTQLKKAVSQLMSELGATHFQIGKSYEYTGRLNKTSLGLLKAIKQELDPKGLINPGALGLAKQSE